MENLANLSPVELSNLCSELEMYDFKSILLTFYTEGPANFITAASSLDKKEKIKYMLAIRPYHMTPRMLSMIVNGFDNIQKDRIMINIVNGTAMLEDKDSSSLSDEEKRIFSRNFINQYYKNNLSNTKLDFVFSGNSEFVFETAKLNNQYVMLYIDNYLHNINLYKEYDKKIIAVKVFVYDTKKELDDFLSIKENKTYNSIIGTKEEVAEKILNLEKYGVNKVMIVPFFNDKNHKIFNAIKIIKENDVRISS